MAVTSMDGCGVVSAQAHFALEQTDDVVSARNRAGVIVDGYLIGQSSGADLHFRYVQTDRNGSLDVGVSDGALERLPDGRPRMVEHFRWITREGVRTNIFEEIPFKDDVPCT